MRSTLIVLTLMVFLISNCSATATKRSFGEVTDDSVVLLKLRAKLVKDKVVKSSKITLKIRKGIVSMSGLLADQRQIDRAIEIAEQQRGVKEVRAYLVLDSQSPQALEQNKKKLSWNLFKGKSNKIKKNKTKVIESDINDNGQLVENDLEPKEDQDEGQTMIQKPNPDQNLDTAHSDAQDFREFKY